MNPVPEHFADGRFHPQLFSQADHCTCKHIHFCVLSGLQILEGGGLVLIWKAADGVFLPVDLILADVHPSRDWPPGSPPTGGAAEIVGVALFWKAPKGCQTWHRSYFLLHCT